MSGMDAFLTVFNTLANAHAQQSSQRYQADLAQQQAARERAVAAQQAESYRRRQDGLLAASRARGAASGVALAGSPLLADDAAQQEIALGEAQLRAGGEARATQLENSAALSQARANSNVPIGFLRAGTTLLRDFRPGYF